MVIPALTSNDQFSNAFVVLGTAFVQFAFVHLDNAFVQLSNALRTAFAHFASLPQGNAGAKDIERRLFLCHVALRPRRRDGLLGTGHPFLLYKGVVLSVIT